MQNKDIDLSDLLKKKYIELNLKEKKKIALINELAELVVKSCGIKDRKSIFKAILEREKLGSTAIGKGVALPHIKIKNVKKPLLIFARSKEGVDFDSLDGEKTYLFFMLVSPQQNVGIHLKILAKISHLIKDKFVIEWLKKAETKEQVLKIISDFK
jgi:fructose-specific phosphotransferase system IIA component